jgi:hypothetical protein
MSGRYGRYVAALGGLTLIATAAWAQEKPSRPEHHHQGTASNAQHSRQAAIAPSLSVYEAESLAISREANGIARSTASATERQARYAWWQDVLGGLAALLTAVAAGAAIAAAIYARKAAVHTEAAANTAADALDDTRAGATAQLDRFERQLDPAVRAGESAAKSAVAMERVAEAMAVNADEIVKSVKISGGIARRQRIFGETQLRAYVAVLIGNARFQQREAGIKFETQALMRNTGQTAARNIRWRIRCGVLPNPIPKDFRFPIPGHQEGSSLLPSGETFLMVAIMDDMVADELVFPAAAGVEHGFFVWGYVIYEDVFRRTRRTTFAHQVIFEPSGPMDQNWNYPPPAIRGVYLAKHNKAN